MPPIPDGEEPITQVVNEDQVVEAPTVPPPPPGAHAANPDGEEEEIAELDDEAIEELSEDELEAEAEQAPAPPPQAPAPPPQAAPPPPQPPATPAAADRSDGLIEEAITRAREALLPAGLRRRAARYDAELKALDPAADPAGVALLNHEIGGLLQALGDEGAAVKAYARALQADPTLKPNLWAIRRVFEARQLWPNLLKLLDAEIKFARTDAERAELLVEKGQLIEDKLGKPEEARACFVKATEVWPECLSAWMALEKAYARDGDLAALRRAVRGLATATADPGRKAALLLDLAQLEREAGGTVEEAIELCKEAYVTGADPERALDELERLAGPAGRSEDLVWALEARALLLVQQHGQAEPAAMPALADRIVAVRRRQAQVARDAADFEGAFGHLSEALKIAPRDPLVLRDLSEVAEVLGRWEDLAELLGRRLEQAAPRERLRLMLERADALRRAGRAEEADTAESEVAREAPEHLGLLVMRERDALRAGDLERLAALYLAEGELAESGRSEAGAPDPVWAATAFTQAGAIYGDHLGREPEAQAALERAQKVVPGFRAAVQALDRMYARAGKHAERAALLERELEGEREGPRAERLLENLVAVREALDDPAGAAQAARRLCALRPTDARLRLRLVDLDRAAGRFAEMAEDLRELAQILSEEQRVEALVWRAEVLERRLGDPARALEAYKDVLHLRPGERRATEAFEAISRRSSQSGPHEAPAAPAWDELASALRREAEASLNPERVAQVLLRLGELHERERGKPEDAAQAYRDLLDRVPGHAAALRGLQRACEALGDHAARVAAAEHEVEALTDGSSRAVALALVGELYEDALGRDEEAAEAYGRALAEGEATPAAAHAALGRFRAAVRKGEAQAAAGALTQLAAQLGPQPEGGGARAALFDERAWVQRLAGDADASLGLARSAAGEGGAGVLERLGVARLEARAPAELPAALEALAEAVEDPALQATLYRRAGTLALAAGGEAIGVAGERLARAQALQPSEPASVIALCDVAPTAEALKQRLAFAEGDEQVEWLLACAEALEETGRLAEAAREIERAQAMDPRHLPVLEAARRLARKGGDQAGYARATTRLAAEVRDVARAAALYAEAGDAFERLGQREEAAAAFRAVLDKTPLDDEAWRRAHALLVALHAEEGRPAPLVELYTHRLAHVTEPRDRTELLFERAQVLEAEGDREGAERDLRALLALDADHVGALRRLALLLGQTPPGRAEALTLLSRYLTLETAPEHRHGALLEMARLEELPGGRPEAAIAHLEAAIALSPPGPAQLADRERLAELLVRLRLWQRAVQALEPVAALKPDGAERAAVEVRIADLHRDGLADPRAAQAALMRALESEPLALEALERLVALTEAGQVVPLELEDRLERAIDRARQRVQADPSAPAPYQALTRLWGWRGVEHPRTLAAQALALVQGGTPPPPDAAIDPTRELGPQGWERALAPEARSVALEIWRLAQEASLKLYGLSPEQLGVGRGDRVNPKAMPPGFAHVDKIARALGCQGYELYAARDRDTCEVAGAALVCGAAFTDKPTPAARFRVARKLVLLKERLGSIERIDDEELDLFFAACAKVAELPRPASLKVASEAKLDERARAVGKALGRKERKALAALGARFGELPEPRAWKRAMLDGAVRLGMVISGDLQAALEVMSLGPADPWARDLIGFALSAEYLALRRELGL